MNTKWTRARVCRLCLTSRVAPLCLSTASDPHSENRFPMVAITHPSMVQTYTRAVQRAALCKGVPLSLKSRQPTHTHPPSWMTPHRNTHFCLLNTHILPLKRSNIAEELPGFRGSRSPHCSRGSWWIPSWRCTSCRPRSPHRPPGPC